MAFLPNRTPPSPMGGGMRQILQRFRQNQQLVGNGNREIGQFAGGGGSPFHPHLPFHPHPPTPPQFHPHPGGRGMFDGQFRHPFGGGFEPVDSGLRRGTPAPPPPPVGRGGGFNNLLNDLTGGLNDTQLQNLENGMMPGHMHGDFARLGLNANQLKLLGGLLSGQTNPTDGSDPLHILGSGVLGGNMNAQQLQGLLNLFGGGMGQRPTGIFKVRGPGAGGYGNPLPPGGYRPMPL